MFNTAWKVSVFGVFLVSISRYSVQMRENTDQKNSEYEHFSRSARYFWKHYLSKVSLVGLQWLLLATGMWPYRILILEQSIAFLFWMKWMENKFKKHLKKNFKVTFFKVRIALYFCFHALAWAYLRKLYWNSLYWVFSYSNANCARCVCKMWLVLTKRKNFPLLWEQGWLITSLVFGCIKLRLRGWSRGDLSTGS